MFYLRYMVSLAVLLLALPIGAQEDMEEEEDFGSVVSDLPEEDRSDEMMTRALSPALLAIAAQVDQITSAVRDYREKGEYDKAEEALATFSVEKAQELDGFSRLALAGAHFNLGTDYLKRKRYAEAVSAYRRAVQIDTLTAKAAYSLGTALRLAGQYMQAVATLIEATKLSPDLASAYFSLGSAYWKLGKLDEATKAYEMATQKNPKHIPAHFMLGTVAWKQRDYPAAAKAWEAVLQIDANHAKAKKWLGRAKTQIDDGVQPRGVRG